ncbi:DMT family transporter [Agrobacterium tumefaciens]|jgi:drug/metabolite transporter (DMT)-like permease|uniref:DMT family transporter n=1 Tax=Agrobacterium tumefaciens TaxID=358 RepID=UPI001574CF92|nr:DMT family transporter [Agrobacterium tumefaciens]
MNPAHDRLIGIYMVIASAVMWSTAGLFVRMADMDVWSMVAWRSGFSVITLGAFVLVRKRTSRRHPAKTFGLPGVAACVVSAFTAISYIASLQWTTVANVMTVYATLPFVATGIAFVCLRDQVTHRFVIAGCVAFIGVTISAGGAVSATDFIGIVAAFLMTAGCATQIVLVKRFPSMDSTLMTVYAGLACLCVALPIMQFSLPAPTQLIACAFYGVLTTGLGYILLLLGSRRVGSGEAGLLSMLDVVLGPLWVLLFYNEYISLPVLAGGMVVLTAVVWYLIADRRTIAAAASTTA